MTISDLVYLSQLAGAAAFVLGLHYMNSPATARNGNLLSAGGMILAVAATLVGLVTRQGGLSTASWAIIIAGFAIGAGAGLWMARNVKMTAMPQLVSLFNAVGGGAAALVAMVFGATNVVGGYVVTDRMLQMFKKKPTAPKAEAKG